MLRRDFVRAVVVVGLVPNGMLAQQAGKPQLHLRAPVALTHIADAVAEYLE